MSSNIKKRPLGRFFILLSIDSDQFCNLLETILFDKNDIRQERYRDKPYYELVGGIYLRSFKLPLS